MERDGELCLTAVGVRRKLPVPGRGFWEFPRGPLCSVPDALDRWLEWLCIRLGKDAARIRLGPAALLSEGGDEIETLLEVRGYTRRRMLGGWATLVVDLTRDEDQILQGFRSATRRAIRKSGRLGLTVEAEDDPRGRQALSTLQDELARVTPVQPVDTDELERISRSWLRDGSGGTILVARHLGEPAAAALVLRYRDRAYLPLIPSSRSHRDLPASHLLVWEAIRWMRQHRCATLDFSGYSLVARPGDPLWGINQFKRGFAGDHGVIERTVAIHERVQSPWIASSAQLVRRLEDRFRDGAVKRNGADQ